MSEYLMYNLTEYLMLTLVYFIITMVISLVVYGSTEKINIHRKITRYFGLISALKNKQIAMFCGILIRTVLITYSVIIHQPDIVTVIIMIILADLIYIILKKSIFEVINICPQICLIYFINILQEYQIEVSKANYVFQIQMILTIILLVYMSYFYIKDFVGILTDRKIQESKNILKKEKRINKKQKEKEKQNEKEKVVKTSIK